VARSGAPLDSRAVDAAPLTAYLSLAAGMALVGSYVGLSKLLVAAFPVFLLAWLRFGIAGVAMLHWLPRGAGDKPISGTDRIWLFWQSFFGNFLFSICMLFGVASTSALAAGVAMAALPAAVALLSRLLLGESIRPRVWAAIACAALGMAVLALARMPQTAAEQATQAVGAAAATASTTATASSLANALPANAAPWWGYALLLCAVLCEASYVVIGKRLTANVSTRRIGALLNLWGLVLVTPLGVWQALSFNFGGVPGGTWLLLVFYALAASMVSVWLWLQGLRHVPASRAGVFAVFLPVSAAAVGVLLLGETVGAVHGLAFALALAGLLLATWPERNKLLR
jgi:drug/metabolite transporter (DMT)-like permease